MCSDSRLPLTISVVWHPLDKNLVDSVVEEIRASFARNKDHPFSRALNIPLFFYSSCTEENAPSDFPRPLAETNLILVFTSVNTMGFEAWADYVESLSEVEDSVILPVALSHEGLLHEGALSGVNCLRSFDWKESQFTIRAVVSIAHEVYRFGLVELDQNDFGKQSSVSLFLSHAKRRGTGLGVAKSIKQFIDNSNFRQFFDATEISPGFSFSEEIEKYIPCSTMIAIVTDEYSSRYWCQREVLSAKRSQRPIVLVDCLEDYEDRVFPATSNVPCVHVSPIGKAISERDILRILKAALLETIRHAYVLKCLKYYQRQGWIPASSALSPKPPELRQALFISKSDYSSICYPEPPLYEEECDWLVDLGVEAFTPLWRSNDQKIFNGLKVGISISEVVPDGYSSYHMHPDHLVRLTQDVSRHLLSRSAVLIYGGDIRKGGFTEFILDEAAILKDRLPSSEPYVENHLAWPLGLSSPDVVAWRAAHRSVMRTVCHKLPKDIAKEVNENVFLEPSSTENRYVWSRCLTEMREQSVLSSDFRVFAGGKTSGYLGKMPGLLEELIIAVNTKKPIYLLGGFGGVVAEICELLETRHPSPILSEEWQINNNEGYQELLRLISDRGEIVDYDSICSSILSIDLTKLASNCGLEEEEYRQLMRSPFSDECAHLILKGLRKLIGDAQQVPDKR